MPTSVVQPRGHMPRGIWTLIGAVVAIVALVNIAVFIAKAVGVVVLVVTAGLAAQWLGEKLEGSA